MTPDERTRVENARDKLSSTWHFSHNEVRGLLEILDRAPNLETIADAQIVERKRCAKVAKAQPACGICLIHGVEGDHGATTAAEILKDPAESEVSA